MDGSPEQSAADADPASVVDGIPAAAPPSPHSFRHRLGRAVWGVVQGTVFRYSPRPLHGWRRMLLRLFGAKLAGSARVYPRATVWAPWNLEMDELATVADHVDVYAVDRIFLGRRAIVSQYSFLCGAGHDFEDPRRPLVPEPIVIGAGTWIAADVYVAPGVTIGEHSVVGARSSVFSDLPGGMVCVGSPAKPVRPVKRVEAADSADADSAEDTAE